MTKMKSSLFTNGVKAGPQGVGTTLMIHSTLEVDHLGLPHFRANHPSSNIEYPIIIVGGQSPKKAY